MFGCWSILYLAGGGWSNGYCTNKIGYYMYKFTFTEMKVFLLFCFCCHWTSSKKKVQFVLVGPLIEVSSERTVIGD